MKNSYGLYSIRQEWVGQPHPMWVVRFQGKHVGQWLREVDAILQALHH